ncbi:tautomerase family protein [Mycobacterium sp.]|uniref:tautomerase family protein n=1 Tax=Mycobacterium sp. TaxID=1785 RepID=UPI003F9A0791
MPIYQCIIPEGLLDESQRENIAGEITRIHCDANGAPRSFVNVLFHDMQNGTVFAGASRSTHSIVFGDIRAGRDGATRQARLRDLSLMWTRLTDEPEGEVLIALREVKAENAIEAGVIVPESGEEQQWLEQTKQG